MVKIVKLLLDIIKKLMFCQFTTEKKNDIIDKNEYDER